MKKSLLIKVIGIILCVSLVIFLEYVFISVKNHTEKEVILSIEETTKEIEETNDTEEKVVFDLTLPLRYQEEKLFSHTKEYLEQVYDIVFEDEKFANCFINDNYLEDWYIIQFDSTESLVELVQRNVHRQLIWVLSAKEDIEAIGIDNLPVTENYKQKHKEPILDKYVIKKEGYKNHEGYNEFGMNKWYEFDYEYGIYVDYETQTIKVEEKNGLIMFL